MPKTVPEFVAAATQKTAEDLITALLALPEDKRGWRPLDQGRSALDQAAECAVTNRISIAVVESAWVQNDPEKLTAALRALPTDAESWRRAKAEIDRDAETVAAALRENTEKLAATIRAVPTDALDTEVELPWGPATASFVINYPLWNMAYHEGQISYIATLLKEEKPA